MMVTFGTQPGARNPYCADLLHREWAGMGYDHGINQVRRAKAHSCGTTKAVSERPVRQYLAGVEEGPRRTQPPRTCRMIFSPSQARRTAFEISVGNRKTSF